MGRMGRIHVLPDRVANQIAAGEVVERPASVVKELETAQPGAAGQHEQIGTRIELAGGKMLRVEEAGLPAGTSITVRDLFFNVPARKKFLKAESTELSHVASLVTHYALAHPEMHFELHSATNAMLMAAPVTTHAERIFQIFGRETLDQLLPCAAEITLERAGLPEQPPGRRC